MMDVSAENVTAEKGSDTRTTVNHDTSQEPPPTATSTLVFDASLNHNRQNSQHTPRGLSTYAGVLVEYLREERLTGPLSLDPHLFPGDLQAGNVVEVWGSSNCGKSILTLSLIATALLPAVWSGIKVGGCNTGVIFIDCDQHFNIFQLVSLMYKKVKACLKLAKDTLNNHKRGKIVDMKFICNIQEVTELLRNCKADLKYKIEETVHGCLKSFYYIKCTESVQFPIVLSSLDEHLAKHNDVALVVVDSLSAFSWHDWIYRGNGKFVELKKYYNRIFEVLLANIKRYKVVLLAVKQSLFMKSSEESSRKGQEEQEVGQEMIQDTRGIQDDEDEIDMEEGAIENMTEIEYLGYTWTSSVTYQVIVSKVRVSSKTNSVAPPKGAMVTGGLQTPHSGDVTCDDKEVLFTAEVIKDKQSTKSFYVIGEEGVVWQHKTDVP